MSTQSLSHAFDYTSLESIYELKYKMKSKLILVDRRLRESQIENQRFHKMLSKLQKLKMDDSKQ